jgi:DNA-binding protein
MPTKESLGRLEAKDEPIVTIGGEPAIIYVIAAITQLNTKNSNKIVLKARGRAISKAFDVTDIMKDFFIKELEIDAIQVSTEEVKRKNGTISDIPLVEIFMST